MQIGVAMALGFVSIVVPIFFMPVRAYDAPLFPWIRTAIENLGLVSLLLLIVSGAFVGLISSARFWLLGFSASAAVFAGQQIKAKLM